MKKLFKTLSIGLLAALFFTACNKNEFDYDKANEEQRIRDSIENARILKLIEDQADELEAYALEHLPGATLIDSLGIWYKVEDPGESDSYTYSLTNTGYGLSLIHPEVTVYYTEQDLDGNVFKKTEEGKTATFNLAGNVVPTIWRYGLYPNSITYNDSEINIGGITTNGLKKNGKIRLITSSPWAYDNVERKNGDVTLPANSPLDVEIEIVTIK